MTAIETRTTHGVTLTPAAAAKVAELLAREDKPGLRLRLAVEPGGCAGLQYDLGFDDQLLEGDLVTEFDGVELVVDKYSAEFLNGAIIDYEDTIQSQGFSIDNPNATQGCACGHSFCG
ncbi:MAG: iron-sulfur cluster assembly accessory protein [Bifidobacteriaceae bacterium]|jgi:iron-sulfur cluster assembly accessory protein|nr:iron-sulfur cluster assembly accessory protein [Bifidobacteriaceae bacterium]